MKMCFAAAVAVFTTDHRSRNLGIILYVNITIGVNERQAFYFLVVLVRRTMTTQAIRRGQADVSGLFERLFDFNFIWIPYKPGVIRRIGKTAKKLRVTVDG